MTKDQQAQQVKAVKKFESGIVKDPFTISPTTTVGELLSLSKSHGISGMPVVEGRQLVGVVTSRDVRFEQVLEKPVSQ